MADAQKPVSQRRHLLAPEVIQTSEMDCGPAALKCLLEGHGVPVSYGRLREACQTDVDGTSIDTLEELAGKLGLDAEQVMIPVDHLLLDESHCFPAIVVIRMPHGATHFVVVWRRHGSRLQVMDPGVGRRWIKARRFLQDVYVHKLNVPADDWFEWATTEEFTQPLARRLKNIGFGSDIESQIQGNSQNQEWIRLASLDAATRLVDSLVRTDGIKRGKEARDVLMTLIEQSRQADNPLNVIPEPFWSAEPDASLDELQLKGAVLVRIRGKRTDPESTKPLDELSPELKAAVNESPAQPLKHLMAVLREDGALSIGLLLVGLLACAVGVVFEALLFRGIMETSDELRLVEQRLAAMGYFLVFVGAMLAVEWRVAGSLLRLGRRFEVFLRMKFFRKIPLLGDRYFRSRPMSDMAERSHNMHNLRSLPWLGGQLVRTFFTLVLTTVAICWLFPAGSLIAILAGIVALMLPLAFKSTLVERDLRIRTHTGALSRFYLDALLGLVPIRSHVAELPVRREHESLLVEWAQSGLKLIRSVIILESLIAVLGFGLAACLLFMHFRYADNPAGSLLLAYWALQLPVLGEELAMLVSQYPFQRNLVLRAVEPLGAPEEDVGFTSNETDSSIECATTGVEIAFDGVSLVAAGHPILDRIDCSIAPGEHIAIVGPSGAGKSSLTGLLLGWHRAAIGIVMIDGQPLDTERLQRLRDETVWLDPTVQLWNQSLIENLFYGNDGNRHSMEQILNDTDLYDTVSRLEDGLQTSIGANGGLLSGGEGQRVRFGRALCRRHHRLVILDEPFRGLDRAKRQQMLQLAKERWRNATLLCITHDVSETVHFPRVLVLENGQIVEDGDPKELAADSGSRYAALLESERLAHQEIWKRDNWKHIRLEEGQLVEQ